MTAVATKTIPAVRAVRLDDSHPGYWPCCGRGDRVIGFDPSLAGGALPDLLGIPIEVSPHLPKDTAYLFPATGPNQARFVSDAHFDWSWQIFLWNQKDLARRHLAQLVCEAEERLGLLPEPPPERTSPRAPADFLGHILQDEIAIVEPSLFDWRRRWMPPLQLPLSKHRFVI